MQSFKNKRDRRIVFVIFSVITIFFVLIPFSLQKQTTQQHASSQAINFYGVSATFVGMLGQMSFGEIQEGAQSPTTLMHASGVIVDTTNKPNKMYVIDNGNNRILGYNGIGSCSNNQAVCTNNTDCQSGSSCVVNPTKTPDIVLGQPDFNHTSCNGDNNTGFTAAPTAASLCLIDFPERTNNGEYWMRATMDLDGQGDLYVPDVWNNRILEYFQPFSSDKTGGKGDAIADKVWGQPNFTTNLMNNSSTFAQNTTPTAQTLDLGIGPVDYSTSRGVTVNPDGSIWVADTYNHRVLHFPANSSTADVVLGQPNFTSNSFNCNQNNNTSLNQMCMPTIARFRPSTNELFVSDEQGGFYAKILDFKAPFTTGMSATRIITINPGLLYTNPQNPASGQLITQGSNGLWGGGEFSWNPYSPTVTGLNFNPYKQGIYAQGTMWISENANYRTILIDDQGNVIATINATDPSHIGRDNCYVNNQSLIWPGGNIGFDDANNIYLADEGGGGPLKKVVRYSLPYQTVNVNGSICLPAYNASLFQSFTPPAQNSPIVPSDAVLGPRRGMTVADNQLIVKDQYALKIWNNYSSKPVGAVPDAIIRNDPMTGNAIFSQAVDDQNRLWFVNGSGVLSVYQLPLVGNDIPIATNVPLYWKDDNTQLTGPQYNLEDSGIAFDSVHKKLYIANPANHRVLRISDYTNPSQGAHVDMVLGQPNKMIPGYCNNDPAQGTATDSNGQPVANSFCDPNKLQVDRLGDLYVVDNDYECHGDDRITMFSSQDLAQATTIFPMINARAAFIGTLTTKGPCGYTTTGEPGSPIGIAFDSANQMIVSDDGYYGDQALRNKRQIWMYANPLTKQTPDGYLNMPISATGDMAIDANNNIIIRDYAASKVWMINPGIDPSFLVSTNGIQIPYPTVAPTITPTPTLTPTNTPTPTPVPNNTILSYTVLLHGIGASGDSVSPGSGGNVNPVHTTRPLTLTLFDSSNNPVATVTGGMVYNSSIGNFQGNVVLPSTLPSGVYLVKLTTPSYLAKTVTQILTITQHQTTIIPTSSLVVGDINNDNQISLLDYNLLLGCFGQSTPICAPSDLNDDGTVGGIDYNLFLRELSVLNGG